MRPERTGLLAALIGALVIAGCGGPGPTGSSPSAVPPNATATSSPDDASPPASTVPSPTASAGPAEAPIGENDWVEVVVDRVELRVEPGAGATPAHGQLAEGMLGLVLGGPIEAHGYSWYAVIAPGYTFGDDCSTDDPELVACDWFGYVAAGEDGTPFIERREVECPEAPTTLEELAAIAPAQRVLCFGGETLTFDATVSLAGGTCGAPVDMTPPWLNPCASILLVTSGEPDAPGILTWAHPDLPGCDDGGPAGSLRCDFAEDGTQLRVEGHVDDPASADCEIEDADAEDAGINAQDPLRVVFTCRSQFVMTCATSRG
jgi:hypothetical protein